MKQNSFIVLLLVSAVLTACGKGEDAPVSATAAPVAATPTPTCSNGQAYNPTYGCAPTQYGVPPGYSGTGNYPGYPVACPYANVNNGMNGMPATYPGGGYYNNGCGYNGRPYRWYYYNYMYYYFY